MRLFREVFGDTKLRYTKPATRLQGHLKGYDPGKAYGIFHDLGDEAKTRQRKVSSSDIRDGADQTLLIAERGNDMDQSGASGGAARKWFVMGGGEASLGFYWGGGDGKGRRVDWASTGPHRSSAAVEIHL